jgi:hypothetical protein
VAPGDYFGISVSLDGDTALIGAYKDDDKGVDSGSAYVFTRTGTTWTQQAKLLASDGTEEDYFGLSVSLSTDTALIGAPLAGNNGAGSSYLISRTGGTTCFPSPFLGLVERLMQRFPHAFPIIRHLLGY